jgi:hypothetical protein
MGITKQRQLEERDADLELMRELAAAAGEAGHGLSPWGADFVTDNGGRLEFVESTGGTFHFVSDDQREKAEELLGELEQ